LHKAVQQLPIGKYTLLENLDNEKPGKFQLLITILGLIMTVFWGFFFFYLLMWVRPVEITLQFNGLMSIEVFFLCLFLIGLVTLAHEGIHGLFFWAYTGSLPKFGIKLTYAYAAAPGWYLPVRQYLLIGLSPLILITLLAITLLPLVPNTWILGVWFVLVFNAGGAAGDLLVCARILSFPVESYVHDNGKKVEIYSAVKK
jgi:hypothetical protein